VTTGLGPTQNGTPINITIDGSKLNGEHGYHATEKTIIRGERIINFKDGAGIFLDKGSDGSSIKGNIIGIDKDGKEQNNKYGVLISNSSDNWIGGWTKSVGEPPGNVISGNSYGIRIIGKDAKKNRVFGNLIGTNKDESSKVGNRTGVSIENAPENLIGGGKYAGNVISDNQWNGIFIFGEDARGNKVLGNLIGTDKDGEEKLGNGENGVDIALAPENEIGGKWDGAGNVISGNGDSGVTISEKSAKGNKVLGNLIGTDKDGEEKLGNGDNGVQIWDAPENVIGGVEKGAGNVISGNEKDGVEIWKEGAKGNKVLGNQIGTDKDGEEKLGNGKGGVDISNAPENVIGGVEKGAGNVISGNEFFGINIQRKYAKSNKVLGNLIGTDKDGEEKLGNGGSGVTIWGSPENVIGGEQKGAGNVISGNEGDGVNILKKGAKGNKVLGNLIGTDKDGEKKLGNGENGVDINSAPENVIGGAYSSRNYISGNFEHGVVIYGKSALKNKVQGNAIGILPSYKDAENGENGVRISRSASNNIIGEEEPKGHAAGNWIVTKNKSGVVVMGVLGRYPKRNAILSNNIRIVEIKSDKASQKAIGIDLGNNGPTYNDRFPYGSNSRQNYPVLDSTILNNKLAIKGSLNSRSGKAYTIQFFKGKCDPKKGELSYNFFDSTSVVTDEQGNGKFEYESESYGYVKVGDFISATATDPDGNTSEFSECIPVEEE
jgi:hypothetical protein